MESLIQAAYALGGAWAVLCLALAYALVHVYRQRERERRENDKELKEARKMLQRLQLTVIDLARRQKEKARLSVPPPRSAPDSSYEDDDEEDMRPSILDVREDEPEHVLRKRDLVVERLVRKYLSQG